MSELIDRSIADLQDLATEFSSELRPAPPSELQSDRVRRKKEVLLTISVLLPKLRAARGASPHAERDLSRGSLNCEED
jgi:hypothetical protein